MKIPLSSLHPEPRISCVVTIKKFVLKNSAELPKHLSDVDAVADIQNAMITIDCSMIFITDESEISDFPTPFFARMMQCNVQIDATRNNVLLRCSIH